MRDIAADGSVVRAAQWLADQAEPVSDVMKELRQRFDLTAVQAAHACTMAKEFRAYRRAFS